MLPSRLRLVCRMGLPHLACVSTVLLQVVGSSTSMFHTYVFPTWFPRARIFCSKSMEKRMNQMLHSLYSKRCSTVVLVSVWRTSSCSRSPGFQHTMQFSHDLDRTKLPSQRTQST
uniref:Putative secreted protein n=1 Tax=Ixodes ricinus TaxID=34613 RepID=A0A6B0ULA1_IXORI